MDFSNGVAHSFRNNVGQVRFSSDSALHVMFHMVAVQNEWESKQQGRPIFEDKVFVRIVIPDKRNPDIYDQEATDEDKARFPEQWQAFVASGGGNDTPIIGTPLSAFVSLSKSRIAELNAMHIYTVDQLASLSDAQVVNIGMGGQALREQARAFLVATQDVAIATQAHSENEVLKAELEELKIQLAEILKAKRKRNNKPKESEIEDIDEDI